MPVNPVVVDNGRSLAGVVAELKDEFKDFVSTRVAMFRSEMAEKIHTVKMSAPMMIIGGVMLATAWLLITGCIVAAVYVAFEGSPWAGFWALGIVGVVYALFGGVAVLFAYKEITDRGLAPKRTLRVLKDDQLWMANEAKVQL